MHIRQKFSDVHNRFYFILLGLFFLISITRAGGWYDMGMDNQIQHFRAVTSFAQDLRYLYALGDNNEFYQSMDGGKSWQVSTIEAPGTLTSIAAGYDWRLARIILVAVGSNGTVMRYESDVQTWTSIDTLTAVNLNSVLFAMDTGNFWIGGEQGKVFTSDDFGEHWNSIPVDDPTLNVREIAAGSDNVQLITTRNDSVFIVPGQDGMFITSLGDTIPDFQFTYIFRPELSGGDEIRGYLKQYYIIGYIKGTQTTMVYKKTVVNGASDILDLRFVGDMGRMNGFSGLVRKNAVQTLWLSTDDGRILESRDEGLSWMSIYHTPDNLAMGPFLTSNYDPTRGRAFGEGGRVLAYGLNLLSMWPMENSLVDLKTDHLELTFSLPPDLFSLRNGLFLTSSLTGKINFNAEYAADDSNRVLLFFNRPAFAGLLPDEKLNVTFTQTIHEIHPPYTSIPIDYNRDFLTVADRPSDFKWSDFARGANLGQPTTNYISGYFNNDEFPDILTMTSDTLYCFSGDTSGWTGQPQTKISFSGLIGIQPSLREQLVTADVDRDGRLDLIVYDDSHISFLMNRSTDQNFSFTVADAQGNFSRIKQVVPFNADNNDSLDLLILASDLFTVLNVSPTQFGTNTVTHLTGTSLYQQVRIADIDNDGWQDLVVLSPNGTVIFWHSVGSPSFYASDQVYSSGQGYSNIHIADLDDDGRLEVLASDSDYVDVYTLTSPGNWDFHDVPVARIIQTKGQPIKDFTIQDFGGKRDNGPKNYLDVALIAGDSLMVYENQTPFTNSYHFEKKGKYNVFLRSQENGLLCGDYNTDGFPDLVSFNTMNGQFQIWKKFTWQPQIFPPEIHREFINLSWTALPDDLGILDYYRIKRDTVPEIRPFDSEESQTNTPYFTDYTDWDFKTFWYRVQAVYNGGMESEWSDPVQATTYYELNGPQSGVISDSTRRYLVKSDISVPAGQTLALGPGINLNFLPNIGFDVAGHLEVHGSPDDGMVDFTSYKDSVQNQWNGIQLQAGADTVHFEFFSIVGAKTGIRADQRPLKMFLGGIMGNQIGIDFSNDSLTLENVILDSNMTAVNVAGEGRALLKNVDIFHSFTQSVVGNDQSHIHIRNAIIWDNNSPVRRTGLSAKISVRYSTVDSLQELIPHFRISKLAPRFLPNNDTLFYSPDYLSPTIDAGDPADDFSEEPQPNGGRINQGLFGGTPFASLSMQPRIEVAPRPLVFQGIPAQQDTFSFYIHNFGFVDLHVTQISRRPALSVFNLQPDLPQIVSPGDSARIRITFTPTQRIMYRDTLLITSDDPHLLNGLLEVPLRGQGMNSPPVLSGEPLHMGKVAALYSYQIQVNDPDGDSLIYTPVRVPHWMHVSASGLLSGIPTLQDTGVNEVSVNIADVYGADTTLSYQIFVQEADLIYTPQVILQIPAEEVLRESAVRFHFTVVDSNVIAGLASPQEEHVRYALWRKPALDTLTVGDTTGVDQLTFYPLQDGDYGFRIWAYNQAGKGINGERPEEVSFSIHADKRAVLRFRWYMVALPREETINLSNLSVSDSAAVLLRWDNTENDYLPLEQADIRPGEAFWMLPFKLKLIDLSSFNNTFDAAPGVDIKKGWNQIGIPLNYSVFWKDMQFIPASTDNPIPLLKAISDGLIEPAVYWFEQSAESQGYAWSVVDTNTAAWPWKGYWLKAETGGRIVFSTNPAFASETVALPVDDTDGAVSVGKRAADRGWMMNISLKNKVYTDYKNTIGISAKPGPRVPEPPPVGDYCTLQFTAKTGPLAQYIQDDFKEVKEVKEWDARVVSKNDRLDHTLSWDRASIENSDLYVYLVDLQQEKIIDMAKNNEYVFRPTGGKALFKIYATRDESFKPTLVPLTYKLQQNYPNPFGRRAAGVNPSLRGNSETTIRFGLPREADGQKTTLRIYDILGREVITLYNGPMQKGYHKLSWNGRNQLGQLVASGLYFYRLKSGKKSLVKKMLFVH